MSSITFKRAAEDEWRIYDHDGDCVGDVFLQADILQPGAHYYLVWLTEDPRGFVRSLAQRAPALRTSLPLPPRPLSFAHSPRRLASGSGPGTAFPIVWYPGSGPSYALRRLGSHTRRILDAGGALSAQPCAAVRRTYPRA